MRLPVLLASGGAFLICGGVALIYPPAALIVSGLVALAAGQTLAEARKADQ